MALDLRHRRAGDAHRAVRFGRSLEREIVGVETGAFAEHDGALDRVLERAHVARPAMRHDLRARLSVKPSTAFVILVGEFAQEVVREDDHVSAAHAKRRHLDVHDVEAIVEVFAEASFAHVFGEIAVGRRDHAHVDLIGLVAADALERALLEHAKELHLRERSGSRRPRRGRAFRHRLARSGRCVACRRP